MITYSASFDALQNRLIGRANAVASTLSKSGKAHRQDQRIDWHSPTALWPDLRGV